MSLSFPKSVLDTLAKLTGEKATLFNQAIAIVKLYTAEFEGHWTYSNIIGILTLSVDRGLGGALFFRIYDPESFDLLFENELYYNFIASYRKLEEAFYCYDVAQGYIGFGFADEQSAEAFRKAVNQFAKTINMEEKKVKKIYQEKIEKKEGFFSKITNFFGGSKPEKKQEISKPINVQQNMSIKFDFDKGKFDLQSLSPEMKRIFKKAGIEKKDLLDKDFAPVIFEKILCELNAGEAPEEDKPQQNDTHTTASNKQTPPPPNLNIPPPPNINIPPPPSINIPKPPGISLNAPKIQVSAPSGENKAEQKTAPASKAIGRDDLLAQIRGGVKLKTVTVEEKKDENPTLTVKITQGVEESLTMTLAKAILERRKQITKDDGHSDSEESPWSDSD